MKRLVFTIFAVSFLLLYSGCTGLQFVREVDENNVFISSGKPNIKIKVDPSFKYRDQKTHIRSTSTSGGAEYTTREKSESFLFENEGTKSKKLTIKLSKMTSSSWYYRKNLVCYQDSLKCGRVMIDGKKYQYAIRLCESKKGNCLTKKIARRLGADRNAKIEIIYEEAVGADWPKDGMHLSDAQIKKLKEFHTTSSKVFEIL